MLMKVLGALENAGWLDRLQRGINLVLSES